MPPSLIRYLTDVQSASTRILSYTRGMTLDEYVVDLKTRDAVERCFEIIGEALKQALEHHPALANSFPDSKSIVGLRNILIHEYAEIDDALIWGLVQTGVPDFLLRVESELKLVKRQNEVE